MKLRLSEADASQVDTLVRHMDTTGYGCLPQYVDPESLRCMQQFVESALQQSHHDYVHFNGPDAVAGSLLDELARTPQFRKLMHDVYETGTRKPAPRHQEFYQVLRCLAGPGGQKNSLIFHYDSYVVTALMPIHIPTHGLAGDLVMYPNTRGIRSTYVVNAIDKVLLDNPVAQKLLRSFVHHKRFGPTRIRMVPGNLYLFWGYRSIHTNEPCDPDKVRATAIFHFANPHKPALGAAPARA